MSENIDLCWKNICFASYFQKKLFITKTGKKKTTG